MTRYLNIALAHQWSKFVVIITIPKAEVSSLLVADLIMLTIGIPRKSQTCCSLSSILWYWVVYDMGSKWSLAAMTLCCALPILCGVCGSIGVSGTKPSEVMGSEGEERCEEAGTRTLLVLGI